MLKIRKIKKIRKNTTAANKIISERQKLKNRIGIELNSI